MTRSKSLYQNADIPASQETETVQEPSPLITPVKRRPTPPYIVDQLIRAGGIHLISGPPWVGMTPWLLRLLSLISQAEVDPDVTFLHRQVHYAPIAYASYQYTQEEINDVLKKTGTAKMIDHAVSLMVNPVEELSAEQRVRGLLNACPDASMIVVEPMDALVTNKKHDWESTFRDLKQVKNIIAKANVALAGGMPWSKEKNGGDNGHSFEKFIGSTAWNTMCHTHLVLDFGKLEVWSRECGVRKESYDLTWDAAHSCLWPTKGRGTEAKKAGRPPGDNNKKIAATIYSRFQPGESFKIVTVAKLAKVDEAAVRRFLKSWGDMVEPNGDGTYKRTEPLYKN